MFSILAPGKTIPQHRGPYNGVLRLHVGLRVLTSEPHICAIRVNGETRTWANDEVLLFDDSYQHDAWNLTDQYRAVLFVYFMRPLPLLAHWLNTLMIKLIAKTPFVTVTVVDSGRFR